MQFTKEREMIFTWRFLSICSQRSLGGKQQVITLSGKVNITVPEGTQNGKVVRLKGKGMPIYGKKGHGDLFVRLNIKLPTHLTSEQKEWAKKMKESSQKEYA